MKLTLPAFITFLIWLQAFDFSYASPVAPPFYWGVANAAFQVEGSPIISDWREWTMMPEKIADQSNAEIATDFWHRYEEDFRLAKELGSNSFRISIAWERLQPQKGKWDETALAHYKKIILTMRKYELEPFVTLHHFVLPKWVSDEGGVLAPQFSNYFSDYALKVVAALSDEPTKVQYWMTFNEPNVLAANGYIWGDWPPGFKGKVWLAINAMKQMAEAHRQSYFKISTLRLAHIKIGVAQHWRDMQAHMNRPVDRAAKAIADKLFNRYFVDRAMKGKKTLDYIGINYYGRTTLAGMSQAPFIGFVNGDGPVTDIGWEIYPQGLEHVLLDVTKRYKLPLIVTENGLADNSDKWRSEFLKGHIAALMRAKEKGANVFGYMHWSLTDNFEWAQGLTPRFGLVGIDYTDQSRRPRPSFYTYKDIIKKYKH